jgi:hypothetical protein
MHRSKLAGFIIDCRTDDLDGAARFWGEALGRQIKVLGAGEENYRRLADDQLQIEVQRVSHESRVHLDIETDDIEAEVMRLERLGARRVQRVKSWWVLEAPTGQRFCVVAKTSRDFDATATVWP